nr:hypothetical protein [Tanacetum cinerariifolium]
MPITRQGTSNNMTPEAVRAMINQEMQRNSTNGDGSHSSRGGPTRPVQSELALMCTKFVVDEKEKVDKYIGGLPDNIHENVMSARPKTLGEAIELSNDLMDQKLRTYVQRLTESKRKFDNNNQAQKLPKR